MGYAVARFTGTVDQNLLCSICSAVLEEAVLTPCGHSFCQMCLHTWIQVNCRSIPLGSIHTERLRIQKQNR